jgi:outer membrane receptor protein involved in Fe transport
MNITEETAYQFQILGTGDLIEIPTGGMVAGAFGATYRRVQIDENVDNSENSCDWHEGGCDFDWIEDQDYYSVFLELFVPILDNLDLSIAANYVDYGGSIGDSFDPKFAVSYRPLDILSLRASWSSAFIAPSLAQQFEPTSCGLQTGADNVTRDTQATFRATCFGGNPGLQNETATVWNVGFSLSLLDGDLNLGADYAEYDFEDRISIITMNQRLGQNFALFTAAGFAPAPLTVDTDGDGEFDATQTPCCDTPEWADSRAWIDTAETADIIRDQTDVVTRVNTSRVNAQKMEHKAYDFYGRYAFSFDTFGSFTAGLSATYVDEFSFDLGGGISGDGAGRQNENVAEVPPMPHWRLNGTVNWFRGNNAAVIRVRRISEFVQDTAFFGNQGDADPATYVDVQYGYQFTDLLGTGREARLEVGVRNLMDYFPDPQFNLGGIESFLHDILGRIYYGRVNVSL